MDEARKMDLSTQMLALDEKLLLAYLSELKSANWRHRRKAARGLASLGSIGARAIPDLEEVASKDPDRRVREAAAFALGRLGGSE